MNFKKQSGFTLIELVVVIVILGILAATAIPRFVDLSDEAEKAAAMGLAGGISSALAINYAACAATDFDFASASEPTKRCKPVNDCGSVNLGAVMQNPEDITHNAKFDVLGSMDAVAKGESFSCNVVLKGKTEELAKVAGISTGL